MDDFSMFDKSDDHARHIVAMRLVGKENGRQIFRNWLGGSIDRVEIDCIWQSARVIKAMTPSASLNIRNILSELDPAVLEDAYAAAIRIVKANRGVVSPKDLVILDQWAGGKLNLGHLNSVLSYALDYVVHQPPERRFLELLTREGDAAMANLSDLQPDNIRHAKMAAMRLLSARQLKNAFQIWETWLGEHKNQFRWPYRDQWSDLIFTHGAFCEESILGRAADGFNNLP